MSRLDFARNKLSRERYISEKCAGWYDKTIMKEYFGASNWADVLATMKREWKFTPEEKLSMRTDPKHPQMQFSAKTDLQDKMEQAAAKVLAEKKEDGPMIHPESPYMFTEEEDRAFLDSYPCRPIVESIPPVMIVDFERFNKPAPEPTPAALEEFFNEEWKRPAGRVEVDSSGYVKTLIKTADTVTEIERPAPTVQEIARQAISEVLMESAEKFAKDMEQELINGSPDLDKEPVGIFGEEVTHQEEISVFEAIKLFDILSNQRDKITVQMDRIKAVLDGITVVI